MKFRERPLIEDVPASCPITLRCLNHRPNNRPKTYKAGKNQRVRRLTKGPQRGGTIVFLCYTNAAPRIKRSLISLTHSFVRARYSAFETIMYARPLVPALAVRPNRWSKSILE